MPPKKRLGEILIEQGYITDEQLKTALAEQKKSGELLGSILFQLGFISRKDLFKVLAVSQATAPSAAGQATAAVLPEEMDYLVRQSSSMFGKAEGVRKKELDAANSPLVSLVEKVLAEGVRRGATDIHINPDTKGLRVRYRIDGVLQHAMFLPPRLLNPIVSRFKILAAMDIAETRLPQDGGAEFFYRNRAVDLRISTFPVTGGENVVVRILDKSRVMIGLENLGFLDADIDTLYELLKAPFGIILVTGPTGSGKTTTLYSFLSVINSVARNIITLEDPVEYQLPLARQSQINVKAGLTFATGLRSILRQDPDVILVGEMRDLETAELTVRAALTGHLVFSTLHTNDALSTIARLVDMGVDPFLIGATLETVLAQRLVRLLCTECKKKLPPEAPAFSRFSFDPGRDVLAAAGGCPACDRAGYRGRTALYEILRVSPDLREMISNRAGMEEIRRQAVGEGFTPMLAVGREKIGRGLTTIEEVERVITIRELN